MNLKDMQLGWFIGMFEPTAYKSKDLELAIKKYKKGDSEQSHFHKKSTEVTAILSGRVLMNGIEYKKDDIITIQPNTSTDFIVLEDTITVVAKLPANTNDKYIKEIKFISHRGNVNNRNENENNPSKIIEVIKMGYDCEIDIYSLNGELYLGHDYAEYKIEQNFLETYKNDLWIHAKNIAAFEYMNNLDNSFNYFWHKDDQYTLTSKNFIWGNINSPIIKNSICVLPESANYDLIDLNNCYGICSDNIEYYKELLK